MLIIARVKFLKVADLTRIENLYDLEPNYPETKIKKGARIK